MECRKGCAACCIAVSINSPIPGMPNGKKAGERCINLDDSNFCLIHNEANYPKFCSGLRASKEMCGDNNEYAYKYLTKLEFLTRPEKYKN
jgi:uncharacterized protein